MTPEEIRKLGTTLLANLRNAVVNKDQLTVAAVELSGEVVKLTLLSEIAAQLAELNEHISDITEHDYRTYGEDTPVGYIRTK